MHGPGRDVRKEKREKRWSSCSLVTMAASSPGAVVWSRGDLVMDKSLDRKRLYGLGQLNQISVSGINLDFILIWISFEISFVLYYFSFANIVSIFTCMHCHTFL
jgi:hypothetical protein